MDRKVPSIPLDVIPNVAREKRVDFALSNSFGFGGTHVALLFGQPGLCS